MDLSVRKLELRKERLVKSKNAGAKLQNCLGKAGWTGTLPVDSDLTHRILIQRPRSHVCAREARRQGGERRHVAKDGGGIADTGSNRARALDSSRGMHGDEERDTTGRPRVTRTAQERRRRLPARRGGTERRSKLR
jgi:hypothetical protein